MSDKIEENRTDPVSEAANSATRTAIQSTANAFGRAASLANRAGGHLSEGLEQSSEWAEITEELGKTPQFTAGSLIANRIKDLMSIDDNGRPQALAEIAQWEETDPELAAQLRVAYADGDVSAVEAVSIFANKGQEIELSGDIRPEALQFAMEVIQEAQIEDLDGHYVEGLSRYFESEMRAVEKSMTPEPAAAAPEIDADKIVNDVGIDDPNNAIANGVSYLVNSDISVEQMNTLNEMLVEGVENYSLMNETVMFALGQDDLHERIHDRLEDAGITPDPRLVEAAAELIENATPEQLQNLQESISTEVENLKTPEPVQPGGLETFNPMK